MPSPNQTSCEYVCLTPFSTDGNYFRFKAENPEKAIELVRSYIWSEQLIGEPYFIFQHIATIHPQWTEFVPHSLPPTKFVVKHRVTNDPSSPKFHEAEFSSLEEAQEFAQECAKDVPATVLISAVTVTPLLSIMAIR